MHLLISLIVATSTATAPLELEMCQTRLEGCWQKVLVLQPDAEMQDNEIARYKPESFNAVPIMAGITLGIVVGFSVGWLTYALLDLSHPQKGDL